MEYDTSLPIYLQVVTAIKRDIINEKVHLGDKLPSVRDLAILYTINPNTASRVYKELENEGICFTKRGMGTFVTEDSNVIVQMRELMAATLIEEYLNGMKHLGYTKQEAVSMAEKKLESQ